MSMIQTGRLKDLRLIAAPFLKKKKKHWGVVYDSKNKQPLDPVIITLTGGNGKVYQAVSDMYGRYDFIVGPGRYSISASKTDYAFPSQIIESQIDELVYENVLTSNTIEIGSNQAVRFNIPMDALKENWNQLEKIRMGIKGPDKLLTFLTKLSFYAGFIWSIIALYVTPDTFNKIIFGVFAVITLYIIYCDFYERWGVVSDLEGNPVAGAIVNLINPKAPQFSGRKAVTDKWGRYNFLVSKGLYKLRVEKFQSLQLAESTPKVLYESPNIEIRRDYGRISKHIIVKA
jgi:hypothetical protein